MNREYNYAILELLKIDAFFIDSVGIGTIDEFFSGVALKIFKKNDVPIVVIKLDVFITL